MMMKLTAKEFLILGMSSSPDGISGKTLGKQIEERNVKAWTEIGISSVYYVLDRLQEKGLLESFQKDEQPQKPGAPEKKLIITDTGRRTLAETVREYLKRDSLKFREINLVLVAAHSLPEEETDSTRVHGKSPSLLHQRVALKTKPGRCQAL